jgi:predicted GIY-YIG superfamily endonuclease
MFGHRYFGGRYFGPRYFGDGGDQSASTDYPIGAGSIWHKRFAEANEHRDKKWRKRRQELEKISRLVDGVAEKVPSDVPEAAVVREAETAVEKAADKLADPPEFTDYAGLAAAVRGAKEALKQAEDAFKRYEARRREALIEADDEDVLLLL